MTSTQDVRNWSMERKFSIIKNEKGIFFNGWNINGNQIQGYQNNKKFKRNKYAPSWYWIILRTWNHKYFFTFQIHIWTKTPIWISPCSACINVKAPKTVRISIVSKLDFNFLLHSFSPLKDKTIWNSTKVDLLESFSNNYVFLKIYCKVVFNCW